MRYVCLVYSDEGELETLSAVELEALEQSFTTCEGGLSQSGRRLVSGRLQPAHTATTVRVRERKVVVADGPFADRPEQLAGFCLIEARDLNDAIRTASGMPSARLGAIEVRPVREREDA
jgi:hypothetical protein